MKTYWACLLLGHRFVGKDFPYKDKNNFDYVSYHTTENCVKCGRTKNEIFFPEKKDKEQI